MSPYFLLLFAAMLVDLLDAQAMELWISNVHTVVQEPPGALLLPMSQKMTIGKHNCSRLSNVTTSSLFYFVRNFFTLRKLYANIFNTPKVVF